MIGSNNITTTVVKNELGENTNNINRLCVSSKINYLSLTKPVNLTNDVISMRDMYINPSLQLVDKYVSGVTAKCFVYSPATKFRLGDFRGYNHNSSMYGRADDITLSVSQSSVSYTVTLRLPGILLTYLHNIDDGMIRITRGIYGTSNFVEQVGSFDLRSASSYDVDTYISKFSDKTIEISCTQTTGLPANGYTNSNKLYISISGGYIDSPESSFSCFSHNITRPRSYDPSRPEDYGEVSVSLVEPANSSTLLYTYIRRLVTGSDSYIRVKGLIPRMGMLRCIISYKTINNNNWTTAVTIRDQYTVVLASQISWYERPYFNTSDSSYDFVFQRSNGYNNDYITEIMITGAK